jgi:hypothetical protein
VNVVPVDLNTERSLMSIGGINRGETSGSENTRSEDAPGGKARGGNARGGHTKGRQTEDGRACGRLAIAVP